MSSIHILTETGRIENKKNIGIRIYKVLSPQLEQIYQEELLTIQEHRSKLQCGMKDVEVVYPEIHDQGNTSEYSYVIIPEFLIPGRPYPIYIYLYAIATYSFNPTMGQREAARRTRERFELKTFSHTTLGRAIKKLEKRIKGYECEQQGLQGTEDAIENVEAPARTFPTVSQTKERREIVASYLMKASTRDNALTPEVGDNAAAPETEDNALTLEAKHLRKQPDYRRPPYTGAFIEACHSVVRYTFLNFHSFLL